MIPEIDVFDPKSGAVILTISERQGFIQAWVVPDKYCRGEKAGLRMIEQIMEFCKDRYIPFRDYQRSHLSRRKGRTRFSDRLSIPVSYRKKFSKMLEGVLEPNDNRANKPAKPQPKRRKTHLHLVPKPSNPPAAD